MDAPAEGGPTDPREAGRGRRTRRPVNTARAGLVSFAGTMVQVAIQAVSLVVLSRLLEPTDFGLYAMAMTFVGFSTLFKDMGLSAAAVQARSLSDQARSNLFWINAGTGLILAAAMAASAPLVESFFRQEGVALVVLLMSPTLLLAGVSVQFNATLQRQMRFVEITAINVGGGVIGLALSITIALVWGGVWALALPQVITSVLTTVAVAVAAGWLPHRPRKDVDMRSLLSFGGSMFGAQIVTYLHRNLDTALIGRWHGAVWTGQLNRATQLTRMPLGMLSAPFGQIALAKMSRVQDEPDRLAQLTLLGQKLQTYPLLLAGGGLLAAADQLVALVLGPGWDEVAPFVRLVVLVELFTILPSAASWLLSARGMGRWLLRLTIFTAALKTTAMLIGSLWGPYGIVAGNAVVAVATWPLAFYIFGRLTPIPWAPMLRQSAASVAYVGLATAAGWAAGVWAWPLMGAIGSLGIAAVVMLAVLGAEALTIRPFRRDLDDVISTVLSARR